MSHSVLKRMLVLPLILLIPVNILVILASFMNLKMSERELMLSREEYLKLITVQADRDIREADQYILTCLGTNDALMRLCDYPEVNTENVDFYLDMMESLQKMEDLTLLQPNVSGAFFRLPASQDFWVRGELSQSMLDSLNELWEKTEPDAQKEDYIVKDNGGYHLISLFGGYGVLIGYQLELDSYAAQMREDETGKGEFWVGTGEEYERLTASRRSGLIFGSKSGAADLVFAGIYDPSVFRLEISGFVYLLLFCSFASVIVAPVLIYYYYRQIFQPTSALKYGIERVRAGEVGYRVPVGDRAAEAAERVPAVRRAGENEFVDLIVYFNEMLDEVEAARLSAYEMKLHQQKMQLNYLSQQIRPHFILNALNSIYTSEQKDWLQTKETILYLTRYFRYIVNVKKQFVRLVDEMEFLKNYLKLQSRRLEKYFFYIVSWEHALDQVQIPPLILSTFVENSMKYALSPGTRSCIAVTAEARENRLRLKVFDGGGGFPEEVLRELADFLECKRVGGRLGVGIVNAVERLQMIYGGSADIAFYNENGALVQIDLPINAEEAEEKHVSDINSR